jgi:MFS family permease
MLATPFTNIAATLQHNHNIYSVSASCYTYCFIPPKRFFPLKLLKPAILSLSLLTILMNAVIVPVLSQISQAFPESSSNLIKLTLSLPALTNIIFSLITARLAFFIPKKYILIIALILYSFSGIGCSLATSIGMLLAGRALLGAGTGMMAPLVTDLIAYFYEGEERIQMIGYSNASSNLSGIFIPLLAGWLAEFNWQYAFWVYGIGFFVLLIVGFFIPVTPLMMNDGQANKQFSQTKPVWLIALMNFLVVLIFYTLPTNLSIFIQEEGIGTPSTAAFLISVSTLTSTLIGLIFSRLYNKFINQLLLIGLVFCAFGFGSVAFFPGLNALIASEILVGIGLGILFPYFSLLITQVTTDQKTTSALSLLSSSFGLGIFLSPIFFISFKQISGANSIRSEFIFAAALFSLICILVTRMNRKTDSVK